MRTERFYAAPWERHVAEGGGTSFAVFDHDTGTFATAEAGGFYSAFKSLESAQEQAAQMNRQAKYQTETCTWRVTAGTPMTDACPACGHSVMLHQSNVNPDLTECFVCRMAADSGPCDCPDSRAYRSVVEAMRNRGAAAATERLFEQWLARAMRDVSHAFSSGRDWRTVLGSYAERTEYTEADEPPWARSSNARRRAAGYVIRPNE